MTPHTWWIFVVAVFFVSGAPGPNMIHVMTRSVRFGMTRSIATMAGCLTALVVVVLVSFAGVASFLIAAPGCFEVARLFGVAYLFYLGLKAWLGAGAAVAELSEVGQTFISTANLFRDGFLVSVSNPKLLLFATAFLPQFIDRNAPYGLQISILTVTFASIEWAWYLIYGASGHAISLHLMKSSLRKTFDRLTGGLFIGFGMALLASRP